MLENKQVIVLDERLPAGVLANSVAALSVSAGKKHPELVGYALEDNQGYERNGITCVPIPILKGGEQLNKIRESLRDYEDKITVIDLIDATSTTRSYDEYAQALKETPVENLKYYGLLLYGHKKIINKFTGSLPLLR